MAAVSKKFKFVVHWNVPKVVQFTKLVEYSKRYSCMEAEKQSVHGLKMCMINLAFVVDREDDRENTKKWNVKHQPKEE